MEKSKKSINVEGVFLFCGGWNFSKSVSVGSTFIREMRVLNFKRPLVISDLSYLPKNYFGDSYGSNNHVTERILKNKYP